MRMVMEYNGAYGTVEGAKTADNHRFVLNNDVFLTREFFLRLPQLEAFKDQFQNIDYRVTPGILVGYDIIDRNRLKWTVRGGPGSQVTKFFEPLAGTPGRTEDGVLLFATDAQWEATTKIDLYGEYTLAVPVSGNNNNMRLTLGTDIEVWGSLDFDIKFILDRQSDPARLSDGSLPENNDIRNRLELIRTRIEEMRRDYRRHSLAPKFDLLLAEVINPLAETADELDREEAPRRFPEVHDEDLRKCAACHAVVDRGEGKCRFP